MLEMIRDNDIDSVKSLFTEIYAKLMVPISVLEKVVPLEKESLRKEDFYTIDINIRYSINII